MRYRKQKTPSITGGHPIDTTEQKQQFGTLGEPSDVAIAVSIGQRAKKSQAYASLNATQTLVNNSVDVGRAGTGTFSNIAAISGQSSKNVTQISMNQRQLEQLASNLNKTQQLRQSGRGSTDGRGARYINRASIGGIIGHQKQLQAQKNKQKYESLPSTGHMPNITNDTIESFTQSSSLAPTNLR